MHRCMGHFDEKVDTAIEGENQRSTWRYFRRRTCIFTMERKKGMGMYRKVSHLATYRRLLVPRLRYM